MQGNTHIGMSVTVETPSTELSSTELDSLERDISGVVIVEKVDKGRLEVIVRVTKLHTVELRITLSDMDGVSESQLAPLSTKGNVEFMARE